MSIDTATIIDTNIADQIEGRIRFSVTFCDEYRQNSLGQKTNKLLEIKFDIYDQRDMKDSDKIFIEIPGYTRSKIMSTDKFEKLLSLVVREEMFDGLTHQIIENVKFEDFANEFYNSL